MKNCIGQMFCKHHKQQKKLFKRDLCIYSAEILEVPKWLRTFFWTPNTILFQDQEIYLKDETESLRVLKLKLPVGDRR